MTSPYIIEFPKLGAPDIGYISVVEEAGLIPFTIKRVFWTYFTPESIVRGRHAHHKTEQVLIAVTGRIQVTVELLGSPIETFVLEKPNLGLYIPPNAWHTMQYSHTAIQMVLASTNFEEQDYIRDYDQFRKLWKTD
ncbi:MAG: FdtA/QdtA family cupin domain-containing protein [Bacteroidota bacterium]|nr:FdtA/QdtA family cupin domain-containing protein [Flavisolibacter sp.]MDQ3845296.1 FdtA/QdtA family cupin domain-containing protein [Bacteroidota bacterium]MBD0284332.1 FdtA/QdtA family cupin domain-containing protein [Flavisolibacter sp.]MBD0297245.1 FdtA/QdtA family cupin domain-containing protein [Flavisolibacter sp.]MBD0350397.1 FdtA/QdtA family cupin domain-containing protein [Flavisolibacter sp.]